MTLGTPGPEEDARFSIVRRSAGSALIGSPCTGAGSRRPHLAMDRTQSKETTPTEGDEGPEPVWNTTVRTSGKRGSSLTTQRRACARAGPRLAIKLGCKGCGKGRWRLARRRRARACVCVASISLCAASACLTDASGFDPLAWRHPTRTCAAGVPKVSGRSNLDRSAQRHRARARAAGKRQRPRGQTLRVGRGAGAHSHHNLEAPR